MDAGNTVLVVEHNLEVIQAADWVIDMGPEAGDGGGRIVVEGPPEDLVIHARRERQQAEGRSPPAAEPLLRSHTGEALEAFGRSAAAGRESLGGAGSADLSPAPPTHRPPSKRKGVRSRST